MLLGDCQSSSIPSGLAKLIYQIGTKAKINFGEYAFDQTMKHVEFFAIKLPIALPCLITRIILKHHQSYRCKKQETYSSDL